jgi:hypothetical protein
MHDRLIGGGGAKAEGVLRGGAFQPRRDRQQLMQHRLGRAGSSVMPCTMSELRLQRVQLFGDDAGAARPSMDMAR